MEKIPSFSLGPNSSNTQIFQKERVQIFISVYLHENQARCNQLKLLIMNSSFSEDVLQKMRVQQKKSQIVTNPQSIFNNSYIIKTQYIAPSRSPQRITYNQIIHDGQSKKKGRYKLRNCRQPNLKVIERKSMSRQKANSLMGLKQLMKQQMQRYSIKRKYQNALQVFANNQIAQNLKLDLLFLPNTVKIPHRNRYRPNKHISLGNNSIAINGNKIQDTRSSSRQPFDREDQMDFPEIMKKTAGFQLKYRKYYLNKKDLAPPHTREDRKAPKQQQQFPPLTGWS